MEREYPIIDDDTILNGYKVIEKLNVSSKNSLFKVTKVNQSNEDFQIIKAFPYETQDEIENFQKEIEVIELLKGNPLFVTYDDVFEEIINVESKINSRQINLYQKNYIFAVMKYYPRKDLGKVIENSTRGSSEDLVVNFLYQSLNALKILHSNNIVHHDIKLSNFLIVSEDPLKFALTDFEFAEKLSDDQNTPSHAGTRTFLAPEILNGMVHHTPVDIWGLGISAYKLSEGCFPYKIISRDSEEKIKNKIEQNNLRFFGSSRKKSANLRNLLCEMLEKDPSRRITAERALHNNLFDKFQIELEEEEDY